MKSRPCLRPDPIRGLLLAAVLAISLLAALPAQAAAGAASAMGTFGMTSQDTARLAVSHAQNRASSEPGRQVTVELSYHHADGRPVLDRRGAPVAARLQLATGQSGHLDLPGNLVAGPGARVGIIPCFRVVEADAGSLALPSIELLTTRGGTPNVLSVGIAKGFDPQPEPPAGSDQIEMPLSTLPAGQTARLSLLNAADPASGDPHQPMVVELSFHDALGRPYLDRSGMPVRRELTLNPHQTDGLELRGGDVATAGAPVGIVPCFKVIRGSRGALLVPTLEFYADGSARTLRVANHPAAATAPGALAGR